MRIRRFALCAAAFGATVSGCAATTTTSRVAVDYNRIFEQARDDVLVENILRAAAHEPQQFSTMGTVTGGVRNSGSITIPIANLFGGKDPLGISPSATINDGINPAVTIVPLADKDFTAGILTPVSADTLNYFFNQGWDPEFILMLTVGGIVCETDKEKKLVLNRGQIFSYDIKGNPVGPSAYNTFKSMFSQATAFPIQTIGKQEKTVLHLSAKDAAAVLKDGVGKDRTIDLVAAEHDDKGKITSNVEITVVKPAETRLVGLNASDVCALDGVPLGPQSHKPSVGIQFELPVREAKPERNGLPAVPELKAYAVLRSVESIIYFLGETQRDRWRWGAGCAPTSDTDTWPNYDRIRPINPSVSGSRKSETLTLLKIDKWCGPVFPEFRAFVKTKFNDGFYFVRRSNDVLPSNRSLSTLTFLDELISLQTSQSAVTSTTPVVTVGAQ